MVWMDDIRRVSTALTGPWGCTYCRALLWPSVGLRDDSMVAQGGRAGRTTHLARPGSILSLTESASSGNDCGDEQPSTKKAPSEDGHDGVFRARQARGTAWERLHGPAWTCGDAAC